MQHDILSQIIEKRRKDLEEYGPCFGYSVPDKRTRPVIKFMRTEGVILEIKRASPSKGEIAPDIDERITAEKYIEAGAKAISVLTEKNYFHGSLDDLVNVADTAGTKTAVLRKDFLLESEEADVSYRCGADAVLLIARILDGVKLASIAERVFSLGMAVLLEIRGYDDCKKAYEIMKLADRLSCSDSLVLGINARDLSTFRIDPMMPARIRSKMEAYCVACGNMIPMPPFIAESGISNEAEACTAGGMKFRGILVGEAAARNPEEAEKLVSAFMRGGRDKQSVRCAEFWIKTACRIERRNSDGTAYAPLVKICGITRADDAYAAAEDGADMLGFIFSNKSRRCVRPDTAEIIIGQVREKYDKEQCPVFIGVITDPLSPEGKEASELVHRGVLDGIQYHGCMADDAMPGYSAVRMNGADSLLTVRDMLQNGSVRVLADAYQKDIPGGTGISLSEDITAEISSKEPAWLAGGITPANAAEIIRKYHPELIDISSGIETSPGIKDKIQMKKLFSVINNNC